MPLRVHKIFFVLFFIQVLLTAHEYKISSYTLQNGLPDNQTYDCIQDDSGLMFFATGSGIVKYDGVNWTISVNEKQLNNNTIQKFIKDQYGTIWAIPLEWKNQLFYYSNGDWKKRTFPTSDAKYIRSAAIYINKSDYVFIFGTVSNGIVVYKNNFVKSIKKIDGKNFSPTCINLFDSSIYISTNIGLYKLLLNDYSLKKLPIFNLPSNQIISFDVKRIKGHLICYLLGTNWLGKTDLKKFVLIDDNFQIPYRTNMLEHQFIVFDNHSKLYFGSRYIVFSYDERLRQLIVLDEKNGLNSNGSNSAYIDDEQNVWFASFRGINKIQYSPFRTWDIEDGLLGSEVSAINSFNNSVIVLGQNNGFTLLKSNGKNRVSFSISKSLTKYFHRIMDISHDKITDEMFFVSHDYGVGEIYENGKYKWLAKVNPKYNELTYNCIIHKLDDIFFVGTSRGIFRFNRINKQLSDMYSTKGYESPYLFARNMVVNNASSLVIAALNGIVFYDIKNSKVDKIFDSVENFYAVYKMNDSTFLAGAKSGLYIIKNNKMSRFNKLVVDEPVYFIEKAKDDIWIGTGNGVIRWDVKNDKNWHFTSDDGFLGSETNRNAFLYENNRVWIGTDKGLNCFCYDDFDPKLYSIKPKIELISLEDKLNHFYKLQKPLTFKYDNNYLTLEYSGLSFVDENKLKYLITVENLTDNSKENFYTESNTFTLRNLDPDTYKIGIAVKNSRGVWSDVKYTPVIKINSPFYNQAWFYIFLLIFTLIVIYTLQDYYNKRKYSVILEKEVKRRTKLLAQSKESIRILTQQLFSAQEGERERIARELHDNVAQDLSSIRIELDKIVENNMPDDDRIEKLIWMMEKLSNSIKSIKELSYFLHPSSLKQTGLTNSTLSLCNEFSKTAGIKTEFYSTGLEKRKFPLEMEINIYRLIQESLSNIRKHAKAKIVYVFMIVKDDVLNIRIEDDGIGFDYDEVKNRTNYRSLGLKSMKERTKLLKGEIKIKSEKGEGTKIIVRIPLSDQTYLDSLANSSHFLGL